jgi:hypothetical protein
VNGQSSATPSSVFTRKSDGRLRCHCAAYTTEPPPTPFHISAVMSDSDSSMG